MAEKPTPALRSLFRTRNRALAREIESIERAADLPSTILILGESGTGKDRLARAIHDVSSRAASPFVRVDAANLSDELFESELFGHERGAFTGAIVAKKGLLEVAEEGTVYLDEVSSLSPAAQAKFLRVLQEKNFRRLAGVATHPFLARLIVSSRRDLAGLVEQGAFRDDFFYRIDVVSIRLPPLCRSVREDILPLARGFSGDAPPRLRTCRARRSRERRSELSSATLARQRARAAARRREGGSDGRGSAEIAAAGSSGRSARGARVAARVGGREPVDTAGADGRVHRRNTPPGRREPVVGREDAWACRASSSGKEAEKHPRTG